MPRRFREAFVICPIDRPGSPVRARSDLLMESVVEPVLAGRFSCSVGRADYYFDDPDFTEIIHRRIARADLIIADLTGLNPNVMYELGHCHLMGLPCVLFVDSVRNLPSDINHHKAIEYSESQLLDESTRTEVAAAFQAHVAGMRGFVPRPAPEDAKRRLIERFQVTTVEEIHGGRRDHYKVARGLVARRPGRALLMQRSSTLILGPEAEWGDEEDFYGALWTAVGEGLCLYHIASKEGIQRHLDRPQSRFPAIEEAQACLLNLDGVVGIPVGDAGSPLLVKVVPDDRLDPDLKPDRQARVFICEFPDGYDAVMVMDLGGEQVSVLMRGPDINTLFHSCMDFYARCDPLTWTDVDRITRQPQAPDASGVAARQMTAPTP